MDRGDLNLLDPWELPDALEQASHDRATHPVKPRNNGRAVRTAQAVVRMLPSEMRSARAAAKRAKHPSLSSFVRALVLAGEDAPLPVLDDNTAREVARLRRDINSGIGANLNQVVHHANAMAKAGQLPNAEHLLEAVRAADEKMEAVLGRLELILSPSGRA
jgi:hypothetical protein